MGWLRLRRRKPRHRRTIHHPMSVLWLQSFCENKFGSTVQKYKQIKTKGLSQGEVLFCSLIFLWFVDCLRSDKNIKGHTSGWKKSFLEDEVYTPHAKLTKQPLISIVHHKQQLYVIHSYRMRHFRAVQESQMLHSRFHLILRPKNPVKS